MQRDGWPVVLFDLDGTVVNTIPLIMASYAHATQAVLGEAAPPEQCRGWIGQTLVSTFAREYPAHADELLAEYLTWNAAHLRRMVRPYDGMADLLVDLTKAGRTIAIVTSKRRVAAENTLAAVGLDNIISVLGAAEDSTEHKPDPEPLTNALASLGRRPADCVYVGDAVVDILAAKAAGMQAIAVTWGAGYRSDLAQQSPHALVDDLVDLRELLVGSAG